MRLGGWLTVALMSVTSILGGCAASQGGAPPVQMAAPEPTRPIVTKQDFLELAEGTVPDVLKNTLEVRNYGVAVTKDEELPELRLELFNRLEEEPLHLEIRTVWFRADGTVIDASAWAKAVVPPRRSYRYRCLAYSKFAVDEQVQLRRLSVGDSSEVFPPREGAAR